MHYSTDGAGASVEANMDTASIDSDMLYRPSYSKSKTIRAKMIKRSSGDTDYSRVSGESNFSRISPEFLENLLDGEDSTKSLAEGFLAAGSARRVEATNNLAALSIYSSAGHRIALKAFDLLKKNRSDRYRFQVIIDALRTSEHHYAASLVTLVNCVIIGSADLADRVRIRNELIGLKLMPVLDKIKADQMGMDTEVIKQIETFEQTYIDDNEQIQGPDGVDLSSLVDVFYAILRQVCDTPQEMHFLTLLQHLLQIDSHEHLSDICWQSAEKLVSKAKNIQDREDAEKLLRMHFYAPSTKLNRVISPTIPSDDKCVCSCHRSLPNSPPPVAAIPAPVMPPVAASTPQTPSSQTVTIPSSPAPPPPPPPMINSSPKLQLRQTPGGPPSAPGLPPPLAPPPPIGMGASPSLIPPCKLPQQNVPQPKSKLRTLPWNKVPVTKVVGNIDNIWAMCAERLRNTPKTLNSAQNGIDFDKLEELFSLPYGNNSCGTPVNDRSEVSVHSRSREKVGNLLDGRRSLNINIVLKQFGGAGIAELIRLIGENNGEKIGLEKLKSLLKLMPDSSEIELLRQYEGDANALGDAEKFFNELIKIPQYELRVECMHLREEFAQTVDFVSPCISTLITAADVVKNSTALHDVLMLLVQSGNFLNSGSSIGNAAGFKLSSLIRLSDTKTNKPKMTILHFVATAAEQKDANLVSFAEQILKVVEPAARISLETAKSDVSNLTEKTTKISKQVITCNCEDILSDMNHFLDNSKPQLEAIQQQLNEAEKWKRDLANFFCEDIASFKMDECFKIIYEFCLKFVNAVKDNEIRKTTENKTVLRQKLQSKQNSNQKTSRPLGYGSYRDKLDDPTLSLYFQDNDDRTLVEPSTFSVRSHSSEISTVGQDTFVSSILSDGQFTPDGRRDSISLSRPTRFRRRQSGLAVGNWQASNPDRTRPSSTISNQSSDAAVSWRERFAEKMEEDDQVKENDVHVSRSVSLNKHFNGEQSEHAPVYSRVARTNSGRLLTTPSPSTEGCRSMENLQQPVTTPWRRQQFKDLQLGESKQNSISSTNIEVSPSPVAGTSTSRGRRSSSMFFNPNAQTNNLDELLDKTMAKVTTVRSTNELSSAGVGTPPESIPLFGNVIGRRSRHSIISVPRYDCKTVEENSVNGRQVGLNTLSYEETLEHCERSKQEIDMIGKEVDCAQRISSPKPGHSSDIGIHVNIDASTHVDNSESSSEVTITENRVIMSPKSALKVEYPITLQHQPSPQQSPRNHSGEFEEHVNSLERNRSVSRNTSDLRDEAYETESHSTFGSTVTPENTLKKAEKAPELEPKLVEPNARGPFPKTMVQGRKAAGRSKTYGISSASTSTSSSPARKVMEAAPSSNRPGSFMTSTRASGSKSLPVVEQSRRMAMDPSNRGARSNTIKHGTAQVTNSTTRKNSTHDTAVHANSNNNNPSSFMRKIVDTLNQSKRVVPKKEPDSKSNKSSPAITRSANPSGAKKPVTNTGVQKSQSSSSTSTSLSTTSTTNIPVKPAVSNLMVQRRRSSGKVTPASSSVNIVERRNTSTSTTRRLASIRRQSQVESGSSSTSSDEAPTITAKPSRNAKGQIASRIPANRQPLHSTKKDSTLVSKSLSEGRSTRDLRTKPRTNLTTGQQRQSVSNITKSNMQISGSTNQINGQDSVRRPGFLPATKGNSTSTTINSTTKRTITAPSKLWR